MYGLFLYGETCRSGLLEVRKGVLSSCFGVVLKASWSVWVAAMIRKGQTTDTVFPPGWGWGGRGCVVFAKYSNQSMYQIQSNDVLKRHDLVIEAGTEMAGESDLAQAIYPATSPGRRLNPVPFRQATLKEVRNAGASISHNKCQVLLCPRHSSSARDKAPKLDWGHSSFHRAIHT